MALVSFLLLEKVISHRDLPYFLLAKVDLNSTRVESFLGLLEEEGGFSPPVTRERGCSTQQQGPGIRCPPRSMKACALGTFQKLS